MTVLRVLIADDSSSVRAVVRRFLARAADVEVVGEAANGAEAVDLALRLRPDVLLLDLEMPVLDGLGVLARLRGAAALPTVILTARTGRPEQRRAFEALRAGAIEVLAKPEDPEHWRELAETLPRTLRAAAVPRGAPPARPSRPSRPAASGAAGASVWGAVSGEPLEWIGIGASTGGPAVLRELLAALPPIAPARILVVQHISPGFEEGLAEWLAGALGLDVRVARGGEEPPGGSVRIAPPGAHLRLGAEHWLELDAATPPRRGHRPSADELLASLARHAPRRSAGVLLSGMGTDGAAGLLELRSAGGFTLAQDEATSAVWGMPRAALERGAVDLVHPPAALAAELARRLAAGRR
ncbi:MAG: chemotaxis protein CheB [Thermoanaerobaculia bacterium]